MPYTIEPADVKEKVKKTLKSNKLLHKVLTAKQDPKDELDIAVDKAIRRIKNKISDSISENKEFFLPFLTEDFEISPMVKSYLAAKCLISSFKDFHMSDKYLVRLDQYWKSGPRSRPNIDFKRLKISTFKAKGITDNGEKKHQTIFTTLMMNFNPDEWRYDSVDARAFKA